MNDWKLARRQVACSRCKKAFAEGERHTSSLFVCEQDLAREDVCSACWSASVPAELAEPTGAECLFWWRTRYTLGKRRGVQLDLEALERFFLQLEGREETPLRELRYVLCLILLRKRRLKVRQIVRDEQGESFIVGRPRRTDALRVFVFDFSPERIEELGARLRQIFEGAEPEGEIEAGGGQGSAEGELRERVELEAP